eukprot:6189494-Pleurochrysis_carterae.AAC.1
MQIRPLTPQIGHGQAFTGTAVYAEGGIRRISPATRSDVSDRQLCFTWCQLTREWRPFLIWGSAPYLDVKDGDHDLYGASRHVLEAEMEVVVSATASRACS